MSKKSKNKMGMFIGGIAIIAIIVIAVVYSSGGEFFQGRSFNISAPKVNTTDRTTKSIKEPADTLDLSTTVKEEANFVTFCGDGEKAPIEECDDGNNDDTDNCRNTCKWGVCGDGVLKTLPGVEECDDGNTKNNDGCDSSCKIEHKIIIRYLDQVDGVPIWGSHVYDEQSWYPLAFEIEAMNIDGYITDITFGHDEDKACSKIATECIDMPAAQYSKLVKLGDVVQPRGGTPHRSRTTLAENRSTELCSYIDENNSRFRFSNQDFEGRGQLAEVSEGNPQTLALLIDNNDFSLGCPLGRGMRRFSSDADYLIDYDPVHTMMYDGPVYYLLDHIFANYSIDSDIDFTWIQTAPYIKDMKVQTDQGTFTLKNNPDMFIFENPQAHDVTTITAF